jgi:hypothetical protein
MATIHDTPEGYQARIAHEIKHAVSALMQHMYEQPYRFYHMERLDNDWHLDLEIGTGLFITIVVQEPTHGTDGV